MLVYSGDAGNFHTVRNEVTLAGARRRADYFLAFSRLNSSNALPNDQFHAVTSAANLGYALAANTSLRFTLRNTDSAQGVPGPFQFQGLAASQKQSDQNLYSGATLENRWKGNWHNLLRYGIARKREQFVTFAPVGTYNPAAFAFYGPSLTITGANGYSATGASVINYSGTYPARYDQVSNRDELYYQSDYAVTRHITALFGFRYENERGAYRYPLYTTNQNLQRTNFEYTGQLQGAFLRDRAFISLAGAVEKNHLFGLRGTPRFGLAYIPVRPGSKLLHGTRLRANVSRGVQEPNLSVQFSSLYGTLFLAGNTAAIAQYGVTPPKAEESRTYDAGVDQNILAQKLILKAGYFHNQFDHQYEYVSSSALQQYFGITTAPSIQGLYGAYTNSLTFRAQGLETELQYQPLSRLFLHAGYTYLAPIVQRSFSSDALRVAGSTTNPAFPGITIGSSGPLVGQRPFRRAPNTGFFAVQYTGNKFTAALKGALSSKSDDSTFLATKLLLPNRNLDYGFAKLDAALTYAPTAHLTAFTQLDNLLSQQHIGPIGYPSLPFTIRAGLKLRLGGE
jgi:iron complex outermembrane receptor protein/vitamin B12 transporter